MEEQRRWSQQEQEDERRNNLHHELMAGYRRKRPRGNGFEQPATQHKEARQAKEDKHSIIAHPRIAQTEMADMREHHENHRKSPHLIDVSYPLCSHIWRQRYRKKPELLAVSTENVTFAV